MERRASEWRAVLTQIIVAIIVCNNCHSGCRALSRGCFLAAANVPGKPSNLTFDDLRPPSLRRKGHNRVIICKLFDMDAAAVDDVPIKRTMFYRIMSILTTDAIGIC